MPNTSTQFAYHEPSPTDLFIISSFLLALNFTNWFLNSLLYCGSIGQIFIGIVFGTPLLSWLTTDLQSSILQLGYLGLLLLVYHGGLTTSLQPLLHNLPLSTAVAITGISVPIGLSFILKYITKASTLQCFTSGAALSATSLGTTFTILEAAGFRGTRLGVVITSAAMMDDIVGLVTVQVVSGLGKSGGVTVEAILRPVGASLGIIAVTFLVGWLGKRVFGGKTLPDRFQKDGIFSGMQTAALLAFVAVAGYSGTSVLFGAFIAGTTVTWLDESHGGNQKMGILMFEKYYIQVVERILVPFFFASIGFSVPIKRMFGGDIVWKGIVYSLLMIIGKLVTGVWILLADVPFKATKVYSKIRRAKNIKEDTKSKVSDTKHTNGDASSPNQSGSSSDSSTTTQLPETEQITDEITPASHQRAADSAPREPIGTSKRRSSEKAAPNETPKPPVSIYPSLIVGLAMVARGEIAFLIASIASANGIFNSPQEDTSSGVGSSKGDDSLYLIVIWAAVICTVVGPIGVGLLVRRVGRLEGKKTQYGSDGGGTGRRVMGEWDVTQKGNGNKLSSSQSG
ncbi:hypothetical protein TWF694_000730 [Orbilia ellipsospora]|uniref:Cation/H+ exchanger transmembrane domain-containing protein n=1 Tax=Orbilia ellipsospora TaxID=2528407 RepID=A0AAV9XQX1_9PEZI